MEHLSPSLRTRIYVITVLGVAGVVMDLVMNAINISPPPPRLPLVAACFVLNLVLLLVVSRLLEQCREEKLLREIGRFTQVLLALQLVVYALLLAAVLGFLPASGPLPLLASKLTDLGANPTRYFAEFFGFLVAAILPFILLRCQGERPSIPADEA